MRLLYYVVALLLMPFGIPRRAAVDPNAIQPMLNERKYPLADRAFLASANCRPAR